MGWYGDWDSKKELADYLTGPGGPMAGRTVARKFSGDVLWAVQLDRADKPFLIGYHMRGGVRDGYRYKPVEESMGPTDASCPLKFLDMVPDPGGYATAWRGRVRLAAAKRTRPVRKGEVWGLTPGCKPSAVRVMSVKPLRGVGPDGRTFRLPRRLPSNLLFWPALGTDTVRGLVHSVRRSGRWDYLPVLADALDEVGGTELAALFRGEHSPAVEGAFGLVAEACRQHEGVLILS